MEFTITEAEVEEHRKMSRKVTTIESADYDENDPTLNEPTQSDNDFITDELESDNPQRTTLQT